MFCRACGRELPEGATFCPACGTYTSDQPPTQTRHVVKPAAKKAGLGGINLVILAAVALVAILMVVGLTDEGPQPEKSSTYGNVTLYGGMVDAPLEVNDGVITYIGDADITWNILTVSAPAFVEQGGEYVKRGYVTSTGLQPDLGGPGSFKVTLTETDGSTYQGRIVVDGDVTNNYSWTAYILGDTKQFNATYTFAFSDYQKYAEKKIIRYGIFDDHANHFVQSDATMFALAESLSTAYATTMGQGASQTGQAYADYLLSFVQCAIAYPTSITESEPHVESDDGYGDLYLFGVDEYWAYPMETIFFSSGDCEDTSILLASLYIVSGYTSAVVPVPGHMIAVVHLDEYVDNPIESVTFVSAVRTYGQYTLYGCETTLDESTPTGYLHIEDIPSFHGATISILTPVSQPTV